MGGIHWINKWSSDNEQVRDIYGRERICVVLNWSVIYSNFRSIGRTVGDSGAFIVTTKIGNVPTMYGVR